MIEATPEISSSINIFGLGLSDWLAIIGLAMTIILGVLALVMAMVYESRSRKTNTATQEALTSLNQIVENLPDAVHRVHQSVAEVERQVQKVEGTILGFYRDILGLVGASLTAFGSAESKPAKVSQIFAQAQRSALASEDNSNENLGRAGDSRGPLSSIQGAATMATLAQSDTSLRESLFEAIERSGSEGITAGHLIDEVCGRSALFEAISELYRLRVGRRIEWIDPVLTPLTLIKGA